MTNYEKIKNMSIEEMAEFLDENMVCEFCERKEENICTGWNCREYIIRGLESEAEDNDE